MIGLTNRKNRLTFPYDPDPDTDSGSLFHFPQHCKIGDFRRFISFLIQLPAEFTILGEMTDADNRMSLLHFGSDPTDIRI